MEESSSFFTWRIEEEEVLSGLAEIRVENVEAITVEVTPYG